jgi:hypothetical protein
MRVDLEGVILIVQELHRRRACADDQRIEAGRGKRLIGALHERLQMGHVELLDTRIVQCHLRFNPVGRFQTLQALKVKEKRYENATKPSKILFDIRVVGQNNTLGLNLFLK